MGNFVQDRLQEITPLGLMGFRQIAFSAFATIHIGSLTHQIGFDARGNYVVKIAEKTSCFETAEQAIDYYKDAVTRACNDRG